MKRLKIVFKDNSSIVYTIKDCIDYQKYFEKHSKGSMRSAILQQYPLKNNEPVVLV